MKRVFILIFFMAVVATGSLLLSGTEKKADFKLIKTWDYGDDFVLYVTGGYVNDDGNLAGIYANQSESVSLFTENKRIVIARHGQGPSELMSVYWMCPYKGGLAFLENPSMGKVKIFSKKNETYVWKETKWFKTGKNTQNSRNCIFLENKWFFAGMGYNYPRGQKPPEKNLPVYFIRVHDDNGKILKTLLHKVYKKNNYYFQLGNFLAVYAGDIYYSRENQMEVSVICPKELKVKKTVQLEKPSFYKAMPDDFYMPSDKNVDDLNQFRRDLEHWAVDYSAITQMLVEGDKLVVQVRTCNDKLKTFALLFYNARTFKLEDTVFTNDLLLAVRDGKYYLFANGHPKYDDNADRCAVNIYTYK